MAQEFDLHAAEYYNSDSGTRRLLPPNDKTRTEYDHWVVKPIDNIILGKGCQDSAFRAQTRSRSTDQCT